MADVNIKDLSGGMRQRFIPPVAINNPDIDTDEPQLTDPFKTC
jgi:hypothetical protein